MTRDKKKLLLSECLIDLTLPRPKDDDLTWTVRDLDSGKWIQTTKPPYVTDFDQKTKSIVRIGRRVCNVCGKRMVDGFVIYDSEYYCSDECLATVYSNEEYNKIYDEGDGYWTEWWDEE